MRISLEDIEDMASPGWGCEPDTDLELLDLEDEGLEDKPVSYTDGRRDGLSTLEICTRLKHEKMTGKNRLEQEFAAILKTYPRNGADFKILLWLAAGFPQSQIAALLGRSEKTIRNGARRLRQFRECGNVKLLPPGLVQAGEELLKPFPPTKAGRPRGKGRTEITAEITTAEIISFDLLGDPILPRKPRKARPSGPRRPRACPPVPGQLSLFDMAA